MFNQSALASRQLQQWPKSWQTLQIHVNLTNYLTRWTTLYRRYFYTARPKNVLNEYFVKLGWGWTLGLVLPLSLLCGSAFNGWRGAVAAGVRCAVATGVWLGFTTMFDFLRDVT